MPRAITLLAVGCLGLLGTARAQEDMSSHHHEMPAKNGPRRQVAVFLYEHAVLHDWAIPAEMFGAVSHGEEFRVYTVSETGEPISAMLPSTIAVDYSLDNAPRPDVVIVPGGNWTTLTDNRRVHDWLRQARENGATVMSVCIGAYALAQAGLLDGREATTLQAQLDLLRQLAPRATVRDGVPFVVSDGVVTTAGGATAIPATVAIIRRLAGDAAADFVANEYMDYDLLGGS